jgi:hypothetical protein
MQAVVRSFEDEPVSVALLRRLRRSLIEKLKPSHASLGALHLCESLALPNLSSARYPTRRHDLEETSSRFELCPLYNVAPHRFVALWLCRFWARGACPIGVKKNPTTASALILTILA